MFWKLRVTLKMFPRSPFHQMLSSFCLPLMFLWECSRTVEYGELVGAVDRICSPKLTLQVMVWRPRRWSGLPVAPGVAKVGPKPWIVVPQPIFTRFVCPSGQCPLQLSPFIFTPNCQHEGEMRPGFSAQIRLTAWRRGSIPSVLFSRSITMKHFQWGSFKPWRCVVSEFWRLKSRTDPLWWVASLWGLQWESVPCRSPSFQRLPSSQGLFPLCVFLSSSLPACLSHVQIATSIKTSVILE